MKDQGLYLSFLDAMIAATVIEHQKPLITRDNVLMKSKNLHVIS
jgi:predicted nucleic acid-binding protein